MSALDWMAEMFGDAVADIRAKLITEGWYQRRAPEPGERHDPASKEDFGWGYDQQSAAVQAFWLGSDRAPEPATLAPPAELDQSIER